MLEKRFRPIQVSRNDTGKLLVQEGVLAETNGLRLLKEFSFDASIHKNAQLAHSWLMDYLTHPNTVPELFDVM